MAIAEAIADELATPAPRFGPHLNVLTNSVPVARALNSSGSIQCTVVGGQYRSIADSFVGPIAIQTIRQFTVNIAFVGVTGVVGDQFSVADLGEADVKRAIINQARRAVVPMDHSKLGLTDFAEMCTLADIDTIVMDHTEPYFAELCGTHGVEVLLAGG